MNIPARQEEQEVVAEVEVEAGEEQLLRVPSLVLVPVPVHEVVRQVEAQAVGAAAAATASASKQRAWDEVSITEPHRIKIDPQTHSSRFLLSLLFRFLTPNSCANSANGSTDGSYSSQRAKVPRARLGGRRPPKRRSAMREHRLGNRRRRRSFESCPATPLLFLLGLLLGQRLSLAPRQFLPCCCCCWTGWLGRGRRLLLECSEGVLEFPWGWEGNGGVSCADGCDAVIFGGFCGDVRGCNWRGGWRYNRLGSRKKVR